MAPQKTRKRARSTQDTQRASKASKKKAVPATSNTRSRSKSSLDLKPESKKPGIRTKTSTDSGIPFCTRTTRATTRECERLWKHVRRHFFAADGSALFANMGAVVHGRAAVEAVAAAAAEAAKSKEKEGEVGAGAGAVGTASAANSNETSSARAKAGRANVAPVDKNKILYELGKEHLVVPIVLSDDDSSGILPVDTPVNDFLLVPEKYWVNSVEAEWRVRTFLTGLFLHLLRVFKKRIYDGVDVLADCMKAKDDDDVDDDEEMLAVLEDSEDEEEEPETRNGPSSADETKAKKAEAIRWFNENFSPYAPTSTGPNMYRRRLLQLAVNYAEGVLRSFEQPRDEQSMGLNENNPFYVASKVFDRSCSALAKFLRDCGGKPDPQIVLLFDNAHVLATRAFPHPGKEGDMDGFVVLRDVFSRLWCSVFGLFVSDRERDGVVWMEKCPPDYKVDPSMRLWREWYSEVPPFVLGWTSQEEGR